MSSVVARVTTLFAAAAVLAIACGAATPAEASSTGPVIVIERPIDGMDYLQGSVERASYECYPGDSSTWVTSCIGDVAEAAPIDTATPGWHTFTVQATDSGGSAVTATIRYLVDDVTPPTVTVVTPSSGSPVYDVGSTVIADFSCDDGPNGSGIEECFARTNCCNRILSGDPLPTDQTGTFVLEVFGFDNAPVPNRTEVHLEYRVVDRVPPTISIITPPPPTGGSLPIYTLGQVVSADYSCSDNYLVTACAGPVASGQPIDTSTAGIHAFTVEASDPGFNYVATTRSYDVHYQFSGFASPLTADPQLASVKAGEKVPVKFSLAGDHGLTAVQTVTSQPIDCATLTSFSPAGPAQGTLSYSAGPDRYLYQWQSDSTWQGTCRQLQVKLDDGTLHLANVAFTK